MSLWLRVKGYGTFWPQAKGYTTFQLRAKGYATFRSKAEGQGEPGRFPSAGLEPEAISVPYPRYPMRLEEPMWGQKGPTCVLQRCRKAGFEHPALPRRTYSAQRDASKGWVVERPKPSRCSEFQTSLSRKTPQQAMPRHVRARNDLRQRVQHAWNAILKQQAAQSTDFVC